MFKKLSRPIRLLWAIAKYSFVASLEYRFRTVVRIIRIIFEGILAVVFINSLFNFVPTIGSWDKNTVLMTFAVFQLVNAIVYFLVSSNFDQLGRNINRGDLDILLTKPIDTHFFIAFQHMHAQNIFRIIMGFILFGYAVQMAHASFALINILLFFGLFISSLVLYFSLISLIATLSFWTFSDELVVLTDTILNTARYPLDIFPPKFIRLFTFVPLIFVVTIPVRALLGQINALTFVAPIIAVIAFILCRRSFHFALTRYSSASS